MSRYIDADALIKKYQEHHDFFLSAYGGDFKLMDVKDKARCDELTNCIAMIVNAPSIDIVRCGECRKWKCQGYEDGYGWCRHHQSENKYDDYCSYGERGDDE